MGISKKEYRAIIDRCEEVRIAVNKNKSQFSADIGMKPQTYNNFIGAQGSKPNVELVRGIVEAYGVRSDYLLFGSGTMFRDGVELPGPVAVKQAREEEQDRRIEENAAQISAIKDALLMIGHPVTEDRVMAHRKAG